MTATPTAAPVDPFVAEVRASLTAGFPVIVVVTHEETRALELLRTALGAMRMTSWTSTRGIEGVVDDTLKEPLAALRSTKLGAGVVVFLDLHPFLGDPRVVRAIRDVCASPRDAVTGKPRALVLVMPSLDIPVEIERDVAVIDLPLPAATDMTAILDGELARHDAPPTWDRPAFVRAALGLTRTEAARAFRLAQAASTPQESLLRIISEKRRVLRRSSTLELIAPEIGLDEVGGLDVLKGWLRARVLAFGDGARAFGLSEPRGMLVCGVQGCGKSMVSKAAAMVLGLPLVRLDFAEVFSTPSPEHAVREAMRVIEAIAPVVLWVDEIEKGLGGDAPDGRQVRVFGAFLTWLQERRAPVFVAATANEVDRLPPELARRGRFDEIFFVDLPSPKEREEILALHLTRRGRDAATFAIADICKGLDHYSGAELEQIVSSALFRAYSQRRDVADADLRSAAREVVPLATLYEEKIQALRTWGQTRARRASADRRTLDLFEG